MTDEELIAWLRGPYGDAVMDKIADRIEALVKELATSNEVGRAFEEDAGQQRARADRLEAALREIESITVHSGGEIHGVTALQWRVALEQAQDEARAALTTEADNGLV